MIIDSVVWIALKYSRDKCHQQAVKLQEKILSTPKIFITEGILVETYNFLLRKVSAKIALETFTDLINSNEIEILPNNSVSFNGTRSILEKYSQLSYTDANLVWYADRIGITEVLSFDLGFDPVPWIQRIS